MFFRLGPDAEFFAIVAKHHHRPGTPLCNPAQVIDRRLRLLKGNCVAQRLAAGKNRDDAAIVLGQVIAVELLFGQAGILEMKIVQDGILDSRLDQVARQGLFPDSFGHPHPLNISAQTVFQP